MAQASDLFIPGDPQNIDLGEMTTGVVRNKSSTHLPAGALWDANNAVISESGPARCWGSVYLAGTTALAYAPVESIQTIYEADGTQRIAVVDSKFLYLLSSGLYYNNAPVVTGGTVYSSGTNVYGTSGASWSSVLLRTSGASNWYGEKTVMPGDMITLGYGTTSAENLVVATVITQSHLSLTSTPVAVHPAGAPYRIYKAFEDLSTTFVDFVPVDNKLVCLDVSRYPRVWNGASSNVYDSDITFSAKCGCFWMDRFYVGNTYERGNHYRWRTRWTTAADHTAFYPTTTGAYLGLQDSGDVRWLDRPYGDGELLRLVPMGKLLMAYYRDRIDLGRPTSVGDTGPVAFEALETGGSGLVGQRAMAAFYDGHFVVLEDNVYWIASDGTPTRIGDPIWDELKASTDKLWSIQCAIDWGQFCLCIGVPGTSNTIETIWRYQWMTKAWSRETIQATMLGNLMQQTGITIDEMTGQIDSYATTHWDDSLAQMEKKLFFANAGVVSLFSKNATTRSDGSPIEIMLETGDLRFDVVNQMKTAYLLSIKLDEMASSAITFVLSGSTDRGATWKSLGSQALAIGRDELAFRFKLTGSMLRFRITCSATVPSFAFTDVGIRAQLRKEELRFGVEG